MDDDDVMDIEDHDSLDSKRFPLQNSSSLLGTKCNKIYNADI